MNIAGYGHLAAAALATGPARVSLQSVSAESQLGLESPVSAASLSSTSTSTSTSTSSSAVAPVPSAAQERLQRLQIAELSNRDRAVHAHEQAHAAVGGSYAGAPSYTFKRGPDGQSYAVGGEVSIDVSAVANDPEATLRKAQQVQRAALAPADPSAQDLSVAAQAQALADQARGELSAQRRDAAAQVSAERKASTTESKQAGQDARVPQSTKTDRQDVALTPNLQLYRRLGSLQDPVSVLDVIA